jgi:ParE toxin of type II toxin-antitoxin system, parDE
VAGVVVCPAAVEDLAELIRANSLASTTQERIIRSLRPLAEFPLLGAELGNHWQGLRFVPGPWHWLIVVYAYDKERDEVAVVTFQDGRSASWGS